MIAPESETGGVAHDALLGERIRQGDRVAENELVGLYSGRVLAMAMVRLRGTLMWKS